MDKKIAIITVVYNNYTVLADFFTSLESQDTSRFHVYVIDLSTEPQEYQYVPFATVLKGPNRGYAFGANFGVQKATEDGYSRYVIINSDVFVASNFIEQVTKALDENPKAIIGAKIYYAPGYEYHKDRYPKEAIGKIIWFGGGEIDWSNMITKHIGVDEVDSPSFTEKKEVDFITGCFMAYDKSVVETVGEWDESWFLYYEDTDYCVRAARLGVKIIYIPEIVLWHKNAQSTGGSGSSIHTNYQNKNRFRFGLKYAPLWTKLHLIKNEVLAFFSTRK